MEEGGRPRTECCSVRRLDFLPRLTVKVFRPNPVYNKMRFSGESEAAWHRQGTSQRGLFDISSGVQNDAVKLRSGAVQREANHTEQRLSLSVQPGLPGTTASTACFVHESAGVGHHDSSQKMATGDQQINGTRRAHLACSAATTSWRQTLLSHGRVEATVTQSAAGRFTRELAKKVTVRKKSPEGRELHKTTWLSCAPALCNAERTTREEAGF